MLAKSLCDSVLRFAVLDMTYLKPLLSQSGFLLKKKKKIKEKEKSSWEPIKKLSIRWIFSFFVKGDDDLSF